MMSRRRWLGGVIVIILVLMLVGSFPLPSTSASNPAPSTPSSPTHHPTSSPESASPATHHLPPKTTCPMGYPSYGNLPGNGIWPVDPNFYSQGPCPLIQDDEVHVSFYSSTPGSGDRWTVPWSLPAGGAVDVGNLSTGFYVGMVVSGDNNSQWNESYLEVVAYPQINLTGHFSYAISLAVLSFANASSLSKSDSCPSYALNLSWNDSYFCEWDDLLGGNPITLLSDGTPGATYNLTFAGAVDSTQGLDVWLNGTAGILQSSSLQLNATTTGTHAFEPAYRSSCDGSCNLRWALPYGLGYGLDVCPQATAIHCNSYNGTAWQGSYPIGFGVPLFWNGTAYAGNYRYVAPLSASGVCDGTVPAGVIVANCVGYATGGGTGFYPFTSMNRTGLNLGTSYPWTLDDFGGAAFQYASTAVAHDLTPFSLRNLQDSSRAGYIGPNLSLNISAQLLDLGTVRSATITWALSGSSWSSVSMQQISGSGTLTRWNATIPSGANGKILFYVNATNQAGAILSSGQRSVVRGPLPTFQVQLTTLPVPCGKLDLNGTLYSNGSVARLFPGQYSLVANGCYPYVFSSWQTSGPVSAAPVAAPQTNLTVSGNGSVAGVFHYVRPVENVLVLVTPASCGLVSVNGTLTSNGTVLYLLYQFSYSLTQSPSCSSDAFAGWTVSGNISILGDSLTVGGNGSLTAHYLPSSSTYTLSFSTTPAACGGVELGGAGYTNGQSIAASPGNYTISPAPCANWGFSNFTTYGSLTLTGFNLSVSGPGTVTENNYELTEIHIVTVPAGCGGVLLGNVSYRGGATVVSSNGSAYTISGFSCPQHYLQALTASGNLTLEGTLLTVSGSGTLTVASQAGTPSVFVGFLTNPQRCGAIDFDGVSYSDGGFASVPPGSEVSIAAIPCTNYGFVGWSPSGGIQISGSTLWANSSGSVTAVFGPLVSLYINMDPANCGLLRIAGQEYTNGSAATLIAGVAYPVITETCPHYEVSAYESSSGANITNGTLMMASSATLVVLQTPTPYPVQLTIVGPGCGTVAFGPYTYSTDQMIHPIAGNYSLIPRPCSTSLFAGWNSSGNVSVSGSTLTVNGSGALVATFLPIPPQVSIASPGAGYPGQPVLLVASVSVVQPGSYQYIWSFGDGSTNITTSPSTTHTYRSAGSFAVHLEVIDPYHRVANATTMIDVLAGSGSNFSQLVPASTAIGVAAVAVASVFLVTAWRRGRRPPASGG